MSMTRRHFHACLLGALGAALVPAARAADLVEGRDWRALSPPQPSTNAERIEVVEFFSYGCPHCADLNPLITAWAQRLPGDVEFQRVPVTFGRAAWASLARLYFALRFEGALERLDQAVFDAVTKQRVNLFTEKGILAWVAERGLDREGFAALLQSFEVENALARANALAKRFAVDAVPRIVVDGRYVVVGAAARGQEEMLLIADQLIDKARKERGAGQAPG
ncbi:MAG: thiol:disulfide interchange protein DsbA/DsbL [Bdellovibrio bacteriovorus]